MSADLASLSLRERRELLRDSYRIGCEPGCTAPLNEEEQLLLNKVIQDYHETLRRTPRALQFLARHRLNEPAVIDAFQLGFADRSLCQRLPDSESLEGGAIRGCMQRIGLLRASGHEHFHGALVVPVLNNGGDVVDVYGRYIAPKLRHGGHYHITLFRPSRGVFNQQALALSTEVVLCASALDALTFWCAGIRNVTATFGLKALTGEHIAALKQSGVQQVVIAFQNELNGDRAARWVAKQLCAAGMACRRATFPAGWDANMVAMRRLDARDALQEVLTGALALRRRLSH